MERPSGSGRWYFRYVVGRDPATGKLRRRAVTIHATSKREAQRRASEILAEVGQGPMTTTATLRQLVEEWMALQQTRGRSPTTLHGYRLLLDRSILPRLGDVPLVDLSPRDLDRYYAELVDRGLSAGTVRNHHRVLSAALNQGVRWDWLERNPAQRATLPEIKPAKLSVPTPEEARTFIAACWEDDPNLGAFVFIAAATGARRGEIAALRWRDLVGAQLHVRASVWAAGKTSTGIKSTKSGHERVVHLDPSVVEWFASWRSHCEAVAQEFEVVLADDAFVISPWPDGAAFMNIDTVSASVRRVADRLHLPGLHLHSLRHFAATELLAAGISARDAAELLGHADPALTLRVYTHPTTERQQAAAGVLARGVGLGGPAEDRAMGED